MCTADVEVLFQRDDSVGLGSITVDWVNDELYWIERLAGGYRVSYLTCYYQPLFVSFIDKVASCISPCTLILAGHFALTDSTCCDPREWLYCWPILCCECYRRRGYSSHSGSSSWVSIH